MSFRPNAIDDAVEQANTTVEFVHGDRESLLMGAVGHYRDDYLASLQTTAVDLLGRFDESPTVSEATKAMDLLLFGVLMGAELERTRESRWATNYFDQQDPPSHGGISTNPGDARPHAA